MRMVAAVMLIAFGLLAAQTPPERRHAPAALMQQAHALFDQKRYAEALDVLKRCVSMEPGDPEAHKLLALTAVRLDRLDLAEPELQTSARLAPDDYLVHFHLGALYYTKSEFQPARAALERAARLNPGYMPALLFLGLALEEVGDEKATIAAYRRAIALSASQPAAGEVPYLYLARYLYRLGRFDESLEPAQEAVRRNSRSAEALLVLGKALHALKHDEQAVPVLERSAAADATQPEPHYLLFRIFSAAGRQGEADAEMKRFQELKPRSANDPRRRAVERR